MAEGCRRIRPSYDVFSTLSLPRPRVAMSPFSRTLFRSDAQVAHARPAGARPRKLSTAQAPVSCGAGYRDRWRTACLSDEGRDRHERMALAPSQCASVTDDGADRSFAWEDRSSVPGRSHGRLRGRRALDAGFSTIRWSRVT